MCIWCRLFYNIYCPFNQQLYNFTMKVKSSKRQTAPYPVNAETNLPAENIYTGDQAVSTSIIIVWW